MKSQYKRYIQLYGAPVFCAVFAILSFCFHESIGILLGGIALVVLISRIRTQSPELCFIDFTVMGVLFIESIIGLVFTQFLYNKTTLFVLLYNVLVYITIRVLLRRKRQINFFISIIAGFVVLLSILTCVSFLFFKFNIEYEGFRNLVNFRSLFHPLGFLLNDWVILLLISLTFLIVALTQFSFKSTVHKIYICGYILSLFGIICSFSRGVYLALLIGLMIFLILGLFIRVMRYRKLVLFFAGTCGIIILMTLPVKKEMTITAGLSSTTSQLRSTSGRMDLWNTSFKLFKKRPLLGVGSKNFSLYANPYLAEREDSIFTGKATNSYLQLLVEKGIIGFIPWGVFVCALLWMLFCQIRARNQWSMQALIVFSVLIAVLFREITFSSFFELVQFQLLFFILAALIVNNEKKNKVKIILPCWILPIVLSGLYLIFAGFNLAYNYSKKKNEEFIISYQNEEYEQAFNAINKSLIFDRNNSLLNAHKANLLVQMSSSDSSKKVALRLYQTAIEYSPNDPYLNHNLAWLYQTTGSDDNACKYMNKAYDLSKNSAVFLIGMLGLGKEGCDKD